MKRITEKPFYYNHLINDFIVDTMHLDVNHKYAYLTLIWEAHRQRGVLNTEALEMIFKRNKDIPIDTYWNVLYEFWDEGEHEQYTNERVTLDLEKTKQHRDKSSEGGKTSSLPKMVDSDKRLDELRQLNKMMPSTGNKRVSEQEGLVKYCKKLQEDKRFTFDRVKQIIKSFEGRGAEFYPALDVIFNDTKAKFWKVAQEPSSEDKLEYVSRAVEWLIENNYKWSNLEERNNLIKQHYKEDTV
jgi:uncharacterized protein YdaU (DUF1376 family)